MAEPSQVRLCLNFMMKNEASNFERLCRHCAPIIDTFCVLDTGSTDGSQEKLVEEMRLHGVEGTVKQSTWYHDYGRSRQEALEACREHCSSLYGPDALGSCYALFIDPDEMWVTNIDTCEPPTSREREALLKELPLFDLSNINMVLGSSFERYFAVRLSKKFFWNDPIHEWLECGEPFTRSLTRVMTMVQHGVGAHRRDPDRFFRDAQILEERIVQAGAAPNPRHLFYCARSWDDADNHERAFQYYRKRLECKEGFYQERYISAMRCARMLRTNYFDDHHRMSLAAAFYLRAISVDPARLEAYADLSMCFRSLGLPQFSPAIMQLGLARNKGHTGLFHEEPARQQVIQELGLCGLEGGRPHAGLAAMQWMAEVFHQGHTTPETTRWPHVSRIDFQNHAHTRSLVAWKLQDLEAHPLPALTRGPATLVVHDQAISDPRATATLVAHYLKHLTSKLQPQQHLVNALVTGTPLGLSFWLDLLGTVLNAQAEAVPGADFMRFMHLSGKLPKVQDPQTSHLGFLFLSEGDKAGRLVTQSGDQIGGPFNRLVLVAPAAQLKEVQGRNVVVLEFRVTYPHPNLSSSHP